MKKWLIGFLVVMVVIAGVGYKYRLELFLAGINLLVKLRMPVGPHQEINWSQSTAETWKGDRPPNIVLIVADDLGWNDLTLNGGGVAGGTVPTPHIDSLTAEGVQFTNRYSACGTCAPSRAALMSGRYPTRFGFEFTPTPPGMLRTVARMARRRTEGPQLITHFDEKGDEVAKARDADPHDRLFWRSGHYQVVIAEGWKLQRTTRPDKVWLFHLDTDPNEQKNVADQNYDRVRKMLAMLDEHNAAQVEPHWPALLESPIRIDKTIIDPQDEGDEYDYWDEGDEYIYWPN